MTSQITADSIRIPADITRILVVEGPEDKTFFSSLAQHLSIQQHIHTVVCHGKNNLATTLTSILNDGNFHNLERIGIICDNDFPDSREYKGALETVLEEIDEANDKIDATLKTTRQLPRPEKPRVPEGIKPKVSVLLLPNDDCDGMLENLVLDAIGEDEITKCADAYYSCLENKAQLNPKEARKPRSRLSVYISGKILDEKYATNDDSRRWFLTQAVEMKWWADENMWAKFCVRTSNSLPHPTPRLAHTLHATQG